MRKPISGIVVVCILQMGFVAYTTLDGSLDVSAIAPVRETVLTPATMGDQTEEAIVVYRSGPPPLTNRAAKRSPVLDLAGTKPTARPVTRIAPIQGEKVLMAKATKLPSEYPIVPSSYASSETAFVGLTQLPKKRSLFSKAVSVVKKPYNWTRSALDRLY